MRDYVFPCGCSFAVLEESTEEGVLPLLDFDIDKIPDTCPATWEMLARGETKGVFQLESRLGRRWTKKLKPESCEHMGALGALLRPGPLLGVDEDGVSMTEHYVRRKNGEEEAIAIDPALDHILAKTYAVMPYQESMMFVARYIAGLSPVAVDRLRKSIGKKDMKALSKSRDEFLEGAKKLGIVTDEKALEIWSVIQKAGRYAFCKSHAICYGIRGYKTAYVKAHFPVAFFTAWLKNFRSKPDPHQEVRELVNDARLFCIPVEPPDMRTMETDVHTDGKVVKFGLANVKGVSPNAIGALRPIVKQVEVSLGKPLAAFSWYEFLVDLSAKMTSTLVTRFIQVGALSWFGLLRARMTAEYGAWSALTEKEQAWIHERRSDFSDIVSALRALSLHRHVKSTTTNERVALEGHEEAVADLQEAYATLKERKRQGEDVKEDIKKNRGLLRSLTTLVKHVTEESLPPYGGCSSDARESVVRSLVLLLENPPSAQVDAPGKMADDEEELLGVALTCSPIDAYDISMVNCTCKEVRTGRAGPVYLGVEVEQVTMTKTKNGKNPGATMARLIVNDGTSALEVVVFPEVWKEFGHILNENCKVIMRGEREKKGEYDSFIVEKAATAANLFA